MSKSKCKNVQNTEGDNGRMLRGQSTAYVHTQHSVCSTLVILLQLSLYRDNNREIALALTATSVSLHSERRKKFIPRCTVPIEPYPFYFYFYFLRINFYTNPTLPLDSTVLNKTYYRSEKEEYEVEMEDVTLLKGGVKGRGINQVMPKHPHPNISESNVHITTVRTNRTYRAVLGPP